MTTLDRMRRAERKREQKEGKPKKGRMTWCRNSDSGEDRPNLEPFGQQTTHPFENHLWSDGRDPNKGGQASAIRIGAMVFDPGP